MVMILIILYNTITSTLQTHSELDIADQPSQSQIEALRPASLLAHVPEKMGYSKDMLTTFAEKAAKGK